MPIDIAKVGQGVISFTDLIGRLAVAGEKALPVIDAIAAWAPIPYVGAIVHALDIAAPYIAKVAVAAPIVEQAISQGVPIAQAIQQHGPALFGDLKQIFAIASNNDPANRGQPTITADEVNDNQAFHFAGNAILGRRWTDDEYQRYWAQATGAH